jgi:DNA anti-recombination protein RmuC
VDQNSRLQDVEKQVTTHGVLIDKFDTALDKITEVSMNVSKLLAVHEQRIETQEITSKEFPLLLENRRQEFNQHVSDLYNRITTNEQELRRDMTNGQKEILSEIKNLRTEVMNHAESMKTDLEEKIDTKIDLVSDRVSKLEKLAWIVIGAASIVGFLIAQGVGLLQAFPIIH